MFLTVLVSKVLTALAVAFGFLSALDKPLTALLSQSLPENLYGPWRVIIQVSIYVISLAQGVSLDGLKPLLVPKLTKGHRIENYKEGLWAEVFTTLVSSMKAVMVVLLIIFAVATLLGAIIKMGHPS